MVPNISDQPAHFLNAEWTIRDGYFFRKFPILGEIRTISSKSPLGQQE